MRQVLAAMLCGSCLFWIGCGSDAAPEPKTTIARSTYEQPATDVPPPAQVATPAESHDASAYPGSEPTPALPPPTADFPPAPPSPASPEGMADAPVLTPQPQFAPPDEIPLPPAPGPSNPLRQFGVQGYSAPRMARSFAPTRPAFAPESAPESAAPEAAAPAAAPMFAPPSAMELPSTPESPSGSGAPPDAIPFESLPMTAPPPSPSPALPPSPAPLNTDTIGAAPVRARGAEATLAPMPIAKQGNDPFDVVQVFYGTDREAIEPVGESFVVHLQRFVPTGLALFVALLFSVLASSMPAYRRACTSLAACGVAAALVLGTLAGNTTIDRVRQSAKEGVRYTTERSDGGKVELGMCEVTIPKTHKSGELEAPSITRLEISEDARKHVVLRKTERLENEAFYQHLRARVAQSSRKELFVFIHGFNTSFEDAARRTAQMAHDLPFEGAPIFYSWPANTMYLLTYPADETNVAWTVPHLKRFLLEIVHESDARSINLVAHSMGNRALTSALRELDLEFKGEARLFNQVVLAAPDIDAADFRDHIAPAIRNTAQRVTLYASSADQALAASQLVHRYPRAGDTQPDLVIADGLDTIDVSHVGSSPWGHSYYGASDPILHDLRMLMQDALPPIERHWLSQADYRGRPYWIFQEQNPKTATQRTIGSPR